jgi:S-formylglutathione hydrolase
MASMATSTRVGDGSGVVGAAAAGGAGACASGGSATPYEVKEKHGMFGGQMLVMSHASAAIGAPMNIRVFTPPGFETKASWPALVLLGGLTASDANLATKCSTLQRTAAHRGMLLCFPDTSPRGGADDPHPLLGEGASYYVDATTDTWADWQMYTYLTVDVPRFLATHFKVDVSRVGVCGHSMGGHGALVAFLRRDFAFASCSALAPVSNPSAIEGAPAWRAFTAYLGDRGDAWRDYDACELVRKYAGPAVTVLVDQGGDDPKIELLGSPRLEAAAAANARVNLDYSLQAGYDHDLACFVATFAEKHVNWHAARLSCDST